MENEETPEFSFAYAFQQKEPTEAIPKGFDAVVTAIDGRNESKLDWTIKKPNLPTLFDIELGLFGALKNPLQHVAQFQALSFAVNRLVSEIDFPAGCILYKGPLLEDESEIDFLGLLVNNLPPHIIPYALQDAGHIHDPLCFANAIIRQQAAGLHLALQNPPFATDCLTWNEGVSRGAFIGRKLPEKKAAPLPTVGIVLGDSIDEHRNTIERLINDGTAFRLIPEERLTIDWDGIDSLILPHKRLPSTERKLQGFRAAGGAIVLPDSYKA